MQHCTEGHGWELMEQSHQENGSRQTQRHTFQTNLQEKERAPPCLRWVERNLRWWSIIDLWIPFCFSEDTFRSQLPILSSYKPVGRPSSRVYWLYPCSQAGANPGHQEGQDEGECGRIKANATSPLENHHMQTIVDNSPVAIYDKKEQPWKNRPNWKLHPSYSKDLY